MVCLPMHENPDLAIVEKKMLPYQRLFIFLIALGLIFSHLHILFAQTVTPLVAVSVPPQAFFVEKIAGGLVAVKIVVPQSANHEAFEPTIDLFKDISRTKIYFAVGHPRFSFEATWLEQFARTNPAMKVINTSAGIALAGVALNSEDPHLWISPDCARVMVRNITKALQELLPEQKAIMENNLKKFLEEIDSLDREIQELFKNKAQSAFLVFHPEWGYFAKEYGLEQITIEQEGKEVDSKTLASTIELAKAKGIKTVFVPPQVSDEDARVVAKEIGGSVEMLDALRYDWTENIRQVAHALKKTLS